MEGPKAQNPVFSNPSCMATTGLTSPHNNSAALLAMVKMFEHFSSYHIPPLFVATTTTFGGLWPFFKPRDVMVEFGFPVYIAETRATHPVMMTSSARTSALGALIYVFYLQQKLVEVDTIMAIIWDLHRAD